MAPAIRRQMTGRASARPVAQNTSPRPQPRRVGGGEPRRPRDAPAARGFRTKCASEWPRRTRRYTFAAGRSSTSNRSGGATTTGTERSPCGAGNPDGEASVEAAVASLENVVRSVAHSVRNVPDAVRSVPDAVRNLPDAVRNLPRAVRSVPDVVRSVPHGDASLATRGATLASGVRQPGFYVGDVAHCVGDIAHCVGDVAHYVGDVAHTVFLAGFTVFHGGDDRFFAAQRSIQRGFRRILGGSGSIPDAQQRFEAGSATPRHRRFRLGCTLRVTVETWINAAPPECFDAARDLDLHVRSVAHTNEVAVGGRTSGLIGMGEEVTWRGRHFGVTQHFTSKITAFNPPFNFQDTMQRGAFRSFVHDHHFAEANGGTRMTDVLDFAAPFGLFGRIAEMVVLRRYLERLLVSRALVIKDACERSAVSSQGSLPGSERIRT